MHVSEIIADQIGHKAFVMMGTRLKMRNGNGLLFDVRGSEWKKINVELTPEDVYTVTFYKIRNKPSFKIVSKEVKDVYEDMLIGVIEENTGLYLSL